MQSAKALIPEAEEAIPELCGKLLLVWISKSMSLAKGKKSFVPSRNDSILGRKEGVFSPSKKTEILPVPHIRNRVVVAASLNVKEMEGWQGFEHHISPNI